MTHYRCHKEVLAAKIEEMERTVGLVEIGGSFGGQEEAITGYVLHLEGGDKLLVSMDFIRRHHPAVGGYFVEYVDGYQSFSSATEFEAVFEQLDAADGQERGETGGKSEAER